MTSLSLLLAFLLSSAGTSDTLKWYSFNEGLAIAKAERKHVLVDFYTDWCGWCKKMDKETYTNQSVTGTLNKHFVIIKVNAEDESAMATYKQYTVSYPELTAGFGVTGFPSTVFLNPEGEYLTMVPGYIDAKTMKPILDYFHTSSYKTMSFADFSAKK
ncbi:MAG: thioredoxin family protein [Bacteroidetes bacterium]|nr:thioredoxin family protein [Bacteroidota bacterium]